MIRLIAESKSDGWALALESEQHWLLRPPYRREDMQALTPRQVARAMSEEDFDRTEVEFDDWAALTRELEVRRVARASPEELQQASEAAEWLLSRATREQASRHFDRIDEALTLGHSRGVRGALAAILKSDSVRSDNALYQRAMELLSRLLADRSSLRVNESRASWKVNDSAAVDNANFAIAQRKSVLEFRDSYAA